MLLSSSVSRVGASSCAVGARGFPKNTLVWICVRPCDWLLCELEVQVTRNCKLGNRSRKHLYLLLCDSPAGRDLLGIMHEWQENIRLFAVAISSIKRWVGVRIYVELSLSLVNIKLFRLVSNRAWLNVSDWARFWHPRAFPGLALVGRRSRAAPCLWAGRFPRWQLHSRWAINRLWGCRLKDSLSP